MPAVSCPVSRYYDRYAEPSRLVTASSALFRTPPAAAPELPAARVRRPAAVKSRRLRQIGAYFQDNGITGGKFNYCRPAAELQRQQEALISMLKAATLNRAELPFKGLSKLISQCVGRWRLHGSAPSPGIPEAASSHTCARRKRTGQKPYDRLGGRKTDTNQESRGPLHLCMDRHAAGQLESARRTRINLLKHSLKTPGKGRALAGKLHLHSLPQGQLVSFRPVGRGLPGTASAPFRDVTRCCRCEESLRSCWSGSGW